MTNRISLEKMVAYLRDRLSEEEKEKIDHQLKEDHLLAEAMGELDEFLKNGGDLRDAQKLRDLISNKYKPRQKKNIARPSVKYAYAAAIAILVIGVFSIFYLINNEENELYSEYYAPYEDIITTRSNDVSTTIKRGMDAYNSAEYDQAVKIFRNVSNDSEYYPVARFYLAQSLLAKDETEDAIIVLKSVAGEASNIFQSHAQWYLALAYLKNDDKNKALEYLELLSANESAYNQNKAQVLAEEIRE